MRFVSATLLLLVDTMPCVSQTIPVSVDFATCSAYELIMSEMLEEAEKRDAAILSKVRARTLLNWAIEIDRMDGVPEATTLRTRERVLRSLRPFLSSREGKLALIDGQKKLCPEIINLARKMLPYIAPDATTPRSP